eukprot:scaffold23679_cov19-Tisochrysis_lutea.AAC.3
MEERYTCDAIVAWELVGPPCVDGVPDPICSSKRGVKRRHCLLLSIAAWISCTQELAARGIFVLWIPPASPFFEALTKHHQARLSITLHTQLATNCIHQWGQGSWICAQQDYNGHVALDQSDQSDQLGEWNRAQPGYNVRSLFGSAICPRWVVSPPCACAVEFMQCCCNHYEEGHLPTGCGHHQEEHLELATISLSFLSLGKVQTGQGAP